MGFRCPICSKDFDKDKDKWNEHISVEHYGAGKDVVTNLSNICENNKKEIKK
jgi:hypothetical protein